MSTASAHAKQPDQPAFYNEPEMERALAQLKVLSHPHRIAIVDLLSQRGGQLTVTDLYTQLGIPQAVVSAHLITMKNRGILKSKKSGTFIYYEVTSPYFETVIRCLEDIVTRPKTKK